MDSGCRPHLTAPQHHSCMAGYLKEAKGEFSLASAGQQAGVGVLAAVNLVRGKHGGMLLDGGLDLGRSAGG